MILNITRRKNAHARRKSTLEAAIVHGILEETGTRIANDKSWLSSIVSTFESMTFELHDGHCPINNKKKSIRPLCFPV